MEEHTAVLPHPMVFPPPPLPQSPPPPPLPPPSPPPPLPTAKYLQEDKVSQKCKDLLSSLPKEKGWVLTYLYQYQGFWHTSRQLQGVVACQKHFQARPTDILLATTPKSGTTWLKAILYATANRTRHHANSQTHPLLTHNPHELVPFLELKVYSDGDRVPDISSLPPPRLFSTHLPVHSLPESVKDSEDCKLVYLCRNPKDTFISLWHFTNNLRPQNLGSLPLVEAFERFCRGVSLYGPFWDHVLGYWRESLEKPRKVFFLKYEDMNDRPAFHLRRLAEFLGCPFSVGEETAGVVEQIVELCSFDKLSTLEVNRSGRLSSGEENKAFFRKGKVGDSANYLTREMIERFDSISEEKFLGCGLRF
ncbi:hypothetical protein Nepgr_003652 [Nepenthes gracilis]|uniref:Sulfotransferase n=1 Tax=Nepenthes gracilis TaxID=150966 RepID=A0AAD3XDY2_NEPGR|nr:hypothetical protein Nepgr_003652 [Nepenthes gracilis]